MGKNNAKLVDPNLLIQAGIDPKTGLPIKFESGDITELKNNFKKTLRVMDEQDFIRKGVWYNLPSGLSGELIERILYYRGQGIFFYMESNDKFYFLPYAMSNDGEGSSIDVYGRYISATPVPFNGSTSDGKKAKPWITGLYKKCIYDTYDDVTLDDFLDGCVILRDYSNQESQRIISRQILNDPLLDAMAEAFPFARTNLISNSGVKGMRVNEEDEQTEVKLASMSITHAALTGNPWIPIVGKVEFQDLTSGGSPMKSEEYLLYLQSLDNYRLSTHGLNSGGLFEKKAHELQSEADINANRASRTLADTTKQRQDFCDLVNGVWGLGIWYEPSESVTGVDRNGDGNYLDEEDQSGAPGEQPMDLGGNE